MRFKAGDKVKRNSGDFMDTEQGGVYVVRGWNFEGDLLLEGSDGRYDSDCFELLRAEPISISICHEVVALDCELGQLKALLDNYKQNAATEISRQEGLIKEVSIKLESLLSKHNIGG